MLACDGIWDCLTNEECMDRLAKLTKKRPPTIGTCYKPIEELFESIIAKNTTGNGYGTDNMTAILIWFPDNNK